ncbi:helix-turn-helix transcriptional regulator [Croceicoccus hydrothermalis]|uniref:helix-turn-helix transcriptional regulator n=1 Tax=Croceicoccus hydrothermalis TaxID=2867964 RepID=UPI001EFBB0F2|nr:AlpA family phage regulatory protein [Croceicoccus hydrothermalis]
MNEHAERPIGRFLKIDDVEKETSLSRWTIRRRIKAGDFPSPRKIGSGRVAWIEREIDDWKRCALEVSHD